MAERLVRLGHLDGVLALGHGFALPLVGGHEFLGEVGLGGEIRPVAGVERRLAEAARQGFRRVFLSARSRGPASNGDLEVIGLEGISELTRRLAA